ncbi:hypothetical protein AB9D46_27685, partial [Burkholderia multivorans]
AFRVITQPALNTEILTPPTAEKHYKQRPIDLLRMWHTKIETWMLNEAGIPDAQSCEPARSEAAHV